MADTTVTDCFGELTDSGGEDDAYGNNENFTFTVDAGSPLDLQFLGPIDIEPAAPGTGLLFDYLILYDGPNTGAPVLDTLYGNVPNPPSYTTSGPLTVVFISDASAQPQGFHLEWSANPPPPVPPDLSISTLGGCPHGALSLALSEPVECGLMDWESLVLVGEDGSTWDVNASAAEALCPGFESDQLTLPLTEPLDGNCAFTLSFTVGLRDACDSVCVGLSPHRGREHHSVPRHAGHHRRHRHRVHRWLCGAGGRTPWMRSHHLVVDRIGWQQLLRRRPLDGVSGQHHDLHRHRDRNRNR